MIRAECGEESGALCRHAKHGQHVPAFVEIFDRRLGTKSSYRICLESRPSRSGEKRLFGVTGVVHK